MIIVDTLTGEVLEHAIVLSDENTQAQKSPLIGAYSTIKSGAKTLKNQPRGSMVEITCNAPGCTNKKMVRKADVKRGWGKFCSKACAKK